MKDNTVIIELSTPKGGSQTAALWIDGNSVQGKRAFAMQQDVPKKDRVSKPSDQVLKT